jgi:Uma2 family endonuclease
MAAAITEVEPAPAVTTARPPIRRVEQGSSLYRLSVEQYHCMAREKILTEDDNVELLNGQLVCRMTKRQPHNISSGRLNDALTRIVPAGCYVGREEPVTASDDSEPEPDLMIVRGDRDDYPEDPPRAGDVALVIEVADASLDRDVGTKKPLYARSAIPTYWLVNLPARRIEVYTDPTGPDPNPDYRRREEFGTEAEVPVVIEGREVGRLAVRELLPKQAT